MKSFSVPTNHKAASKLIFGRALTISMLGLTLVAAGFAQSGQHQDHQSDHRSENHSRSDSHTQGRQDSHSGTSRTSGSRSDSQYRGTANTDRNYGSNHSSYQGNSYQGNSYQGHSYQGGGYNHSYSSTTNSSTSYAGRSNSFSGANYGRTSNFGGSSSYGGGSASYGQNHDHGGGSHSGGGGHDHNYSASSHSYSRPSAADYNRHGADLGYLHDHPSHYSHDSFRTGYYHYNPGWHDRDFAFRGYVYDPFEVHAFLSPFCYYPFLPAYIGIGGVTVFGHIGNFWISAAFIDYPYHYGAYNSGYNDGYRDAQRDANRDPDLDRGVDEIVDAFQRQDFRNLDLLIGRRSKVDIFQDDRYSYSLDSDSFYDLMRDNVRTAKTVRYEILSVRKNRDDAYVIAKHVYMDPWDHEDYVYHTYKLHLRGRDAQITEFGTSRNEPRY